VKTGMEYVVEGARPRGRPKRTWIEVVQRNCKAHGLSSEDATNCGRWRRLIKDG